MFVPLKPAWSRPTTAAAPAGRRRKEPAEDVRESSEESVPQLWGCRRGFRRRPPWKKIRLPTGNRRFPIACCINCRRAIVGYRFLPASVGDMAFLSAPDESDLFVPSADIHYHRPLSILEKPTLSGRKRVYFFGASMMLGSPSALLITALHIPVVDLLIRREEKQLEQTFGEEWRRYKERVRRWL